MLVLHNVKHSGNKAWRPARFVVCEVWSRCLLLTADYPSIMPKNLTLQRDGFPIVSFNSVCSSRALRILAFVGVEQICGALKAQFESGLGQVLRSGLVVQACPFAILLRDFNSLSNNTGPIMLDCVRIGLCCSL